MATGIIPMTNDSGWLDIEKGSALDSTKGYLEYRKIGNTVQVRGFNLQLASASTGQYVLIGTVPTGYRPSLSTSVCYYVGGILYAGYVQHGGGIYLFRGNAADVPAAANIVFGTMYFLG